MCGNVIMAVLLLLVGPSPLFGDALRNSIGLSYGVAALTGIGFGLVMVSTFVRAYREAMSQGYADNISTYLTLAGKGQIKVDSIQVLMRPYLGLWSSSFYLGNFLGPTISGFVVEAIGFSWTATTFVPVFVIMFCANLAELIYNVRKGGRKADYEEIK